LLAAVLVVVQELKAVKGYWPGVAYRELRDEAEPGRLAVSSDQLRLPYSASPGLHSIFSIATVKHERDQQQDDNLFHDFLEAWDLI